MCKEVLVGCSDHEQAAYTATLTCSQEEEVVLILGDRELFFHGDGCLRLCGRRIEGSFPSGCYGLRVVINPIQGVLLVEVTLPEGGTIRRGDYRLLGGETLRWTSTHGEADVEDSICYEEVTPTSYIRVTKEPIPKGFSAHVYNLTNCFDCPQTTRLFSWTALRSFLGDRHMVLQYRRSGEDTWSETRAQEKYMTDLQGNLMGRERYFSADVTGLTADTEYEYRVGVMGEPHTSDCFTFRTAPREIGDFRFVAVGDTQGLNWDWYSYCKAAVDQALGEVGDAAFLVNLGDMTDIGATTVFWNLYFKSLGDHAVGLPHFAAIGNHDSYVHDEERNSHFSLHFHHPQNRTQALDPSFDRDITYPGLQAQFAHPEESVYSFDYGNAHFTVLNTGSYCPQDRAILEAQRAWLRADLEAHRDAKWHILCFHEPVYHRVGGGESRPWLHDTIEEYGVDLVLLGHSHLVTRTYPMKDGRIATKTSPDCIRKGTGTVHVTVGSTTLNHDDMGDPNMEYCMLLYTPPNEQATYTVVSVEQNRLTVRIKQLNGYVVDEFVIE